MNIEIKKLTPDLLNDYLEYFDNIAFVDNEEWRGCYCMYYHWNDTLEAECRRDAVAEGACFRRDLAIKYIENGRLQGYLAYAEGEVVGWCNANDKTNFDALSREKTPELWEDGNYSEKVKSIVCFSIAPHMRRKGIATQLLNKVYMDAQDDGYLYVEAYPEVGETNVRSYHGPYAIYEKYGFSVFKKVDNIAIVRKYI